MPRSLRVAPHYIEKVKSALPRNRFGRQQDLAEHLGISRDTLNRFLNGKPVKYLNFLEICEKLGLNLEEIADFGTQECNSSEPSARVNSLQERLLGYAGLPDEKSMSRVTPPQSSPPLDTRYQQILFRRLLTLDFIQQKQLFQEVIQFHPKPIGAFLVHGKPGCGQQALSNSLFQLISKKPKRICFDMSSNAIGKRSRSMWNHLIKQLQIHPNATPYEIADAVCEWWHTQDVLLTVYGVDCMLPELLTELIEQFWHPIVERAYQYLEQSQQKRYLLMFLVDNEGVCHSKIALARDWNQPDYPRLPLPLPQACAFPLNILDDWIKAAIEEAILPEGLIAQMVLDASDKGTPEDVYEEICKHCGLSWEGVLAKWLI